MWFLNSGSGGDLREAQGSRDVMISLDEVGSRKRSKVGKENEKNKRGGRTPFPRCCNVPFDPSQLF